MTRRSRVTGRFKPRRIGDGLLAGAPKNPAAVALGKLSAATVCSRDRARIRAAMNALRREIGLPEWRPHG